MTRATFWELFNVLTDRGLRRALVRRQLRHERSTA